MLRERHIFLKVILVTVGDEGKTLAPLCRASAFNEGIDRRPVDNGPVHRN